MEAAHHWDDENGRLESLKHYGVLDSAPEFSFDQLAILASNLCQTPIALISFIDENRQWYKSSIGIRPSEVPRYLTACNETIMRGDYFLLNAGTTDSIYSNYMKERGLSFYMGVPVTSSDGYNIGTLCVLDYVPRIITDEQIESLKIISRQITALLELRLSYQENLEELKELNEKSYTDDKKIQGIVFNEKLRGVAELSAGLSFRLKTQMLVIENVKRSIFKKWPYVNEEISLLGESISNIHRLVDSLDTYILAEREKSMKPFEVNDVIANVLLNLEYRMREHDIQCSFQRDESFITIGNVLQFSEVLSSVLMNAIEAVEHLDERKITIEVYKNNHLAFIDIMDTGLGVDERIRPFIFQPFFTTKGPLSLGISLSLGKTLMYRHSGDIELIKSAGPTTFRISFQVP